TQCDDQDKDELRHDLPPPVVELGVEKEEAERHACIDAFGPSFTRTEPNHRRARDEAKRLIASFDRIHRKAQITPESPVRKNEDRQQEREECEHTIDRAKTVEPLVRYHGRYEEQ